MTQHDTPEQLRCDGYAPGHRVHWIPALRAGINGTEGTIREIQPDGTIVIETAKGITTLWNHEAHRLVIAPDTTCILGSFLYIPTDHFGSIAYRTLNVANEPTPCVTNYCELCGAWPGGTITRDGLHTCTEHAPFDDDPTEHLKRPALHARRTGEPLTDVDAEDYLNSNDADPQYIELHQRWQQAIRAETNEAGE